MTRPLICNVDFETYYDDECSVSELGPEAYTRHPRFDPYMVSLVTEDGHEFVGDPREFEWDSLESYWWASHNKGFDWAVHAWLMNRGLVAPTQPERWIDTAALAAYCAVPRDLGGAVMSLYGVELDKGLRKWAKGKTGADIRAAGKWDAMCAYCLGDSRHGLRIALDCLHHWPEREQWLADHTVYAGAYGVAVNGQLLRESMKKLRRVMSEAEAQLPWMVTPPTAILTHRIEDWPRELPMPSVGQEVSLMVRFDPEDGGDRRLVFKRRGRDKVLSILVADANAQGCRFSYELGSTVRIVFHVTEQVAPSVIFTVSSKEEPKPLSKVMLDLFCDREGIPRPPSLSEDDVACNQWEDKHGGDYPWVAAMRQYRKANIIYQRLGTIDRRTDGGRWRFSWSMKYFGAHTGRWSGDGGFNVQNQQRDEIFGVNAREIFVAAPGKKLVIVDLSQIEPRVLYWCAEDWDMLERIRGGWGVYQAHAIATMRWDPNRPFSSEEDPVAYKTAKARVLGLGYQCGWKKFIDAARVLAGLVISAQESKQIVRNFRATNGKIVRLWNKLDHAFKRSVGEDFELELPSGRVLRYYNVQRRGERFLAQPIVGKTHFDFYGGKLTENLVQAAARDVFVEGMMRCEQQGFPVVMHSHDEVVTEVDLSVDPEEVKACMAVTPEWLEGCPVEAKAIESDHYLK